MKFDRSKTAKLVIFKGRVQGVGFRFTAHSIANRYHLTGQVRNLIDGSVEMIAQGGAADIRVGNSTELFCVVRALLAAGFRRIGIGPYDFVHVGVKHDTQTIWI